MKVEDLRPRGAAWTIRLHEKGGKEHAMPCHHALAEALHARAAALLELHPEAPAEAPAAAAAAAAPDAAAAGEDADAVDEAAVRRQLPLRMHAVLVLEPQSAFMVMTSSPAGPSCVKLCQQTCEPDACEVRRAVPSSLQL